MKEEIKGIKLEEIMERENLNKTSLAGLLDVSVKQVENFLNGESGFPIKHALKLQKVYRYSLDYIYGLYEDNPIIYTRSYNEYSNGIELDIVNKMSIKNINFFVNLKDILEYSNSKINFYFSKAFFNYMIKVANLEKREFNDCYTKSIVLKQFYDEFIEEKKRYKRNKIKDEISFTINLNKLKKNYNYDGKRIKNILDETFCELSEISEKEQQEAEKEVKEIFNYHE